MADTKTTQQTLKQQGIAPRYKVLLHNDELHSMEFVVQTLVKCVPEMTVDIATMVMLEAHNTGRGIITICPYARMSPTGASDCTRAIRGAGRVSP